MLNRLSLIAAALVITFAVPAQAQGQNGGTPNPAPVTSPQSTGPKEPVLGEKSLAAALRAAEWSRVLQFDTKGVDFGPWVRRFVAQLKRNWTPLVPKEAMSLRGHTAIRFVVHKDGSIQDVEVGLPSQVEAFNRAASEAVRLSNPTVPLPPEYPDATAVMTVTFYYNETPDSPQDDSATAPASTDDSGWSP